MSQEEVEYESRYEKYCRELAEEQERKTGERVLGWLGSPVGKWYVARAAEGQAVVFIDQEYPAEKEEETFSRRVEVDPERQGYRVVRSDAKGLQTESRCDNVEALEEALPLCSLKLMETIQINWGKHAFLPDISVPHSFHWSQPALALPEGLPFWDDGDTPGFSPRMIDVLESFEHTDFLEWEGEVFTHPAVREEIHQKLGEVYPSASHGARMTFAHWIWPSRILDPRVKPELLSQDSRCALLSLLLGGDPGRVVKRYGDFAVGTLVLGSYGEKVEGRVKSVSPLVWLRVKRFCLAKNWKAEDDFAFFEEPEDLTYPGPLGPIFRVLYLVRANENYKGFCDAYVRAHGRGPFMEKGEHCSRCCENHEEAMEEKAEELDLDCDAPELEEECGGCCGRWEVHEVVGVMEFFLQPYVDCWRCDEVKEPHGGSYEPGGNSLRYQLYDAANRDLQGNLNETLALCRHQDFALDLKRAILHEWRDAYDTYSRPEIAGMLLLLARANGATDWEMHYAYHRILTRRDREDFGYIESDTWRSDPVYKAAYDWMVAQGWPVLWDECL
jgi:hypothetical protein